MSCRLRRYMSLAIPTSVVRLASCCGLWLGPLAILAACGGVQAARVANATQGACGGVECSATADDDRDGVPNARDRCLRLAEDEDGFQDDDGCPEPDNDQDGLPDEHDRCPLDPEDRDDHEDSDGCPEPGPGPLTVTVTEERIQVSDRIYFEAGEDVIRAVSRKTLDEVARAIAALAAEKQVLVIGHSDRSGDPAANRDLSYRRARAVVEYLQGQGVPERRLRFEGRGGEEPMAPGNSPEARAMNRRVEFRIITRSE